MSTRANSGDLFDLSLILALYISCNGLGTRGTVLSGVDCQIQVLCL